MAKYLALWELDESKIPIDPKERGAGWRALLGLVKQELEGGIVKEWGAFAGESSGYAVYEGTELEVAITLQQYVPFVRFGLHPILTVGQTDELVEALLK